MSTLGHSRYLITATLALVSALAPKADIHTSVGVGRQPRDSRVKPPIG
jgi:hypothetical protein